MANFTINRVSKGTLLPPNNSYSDHCTKRGRLSVTDVLQRKGIDISSIQGTSPDVSAMQSQIVTQGQLIDRLQDDIAELKLTINTLGSLGELNNLGADDSSGNDWAEELDPYCDVLGTACEYAGQSDRANRYMLGASGNGSASGFADGCIYDAIKELNYRDRDIDIDSNMLEVVSCTALGTLEASGFEKDGDGIEGNWKVSEWGDLVSNLDISSMKQVPAASKWDSPGTFAANRTMRDGIERVLIRQAIGTVGYSAARRGHHRAMDRMGM